MFWFNGEFDVFGATQLNSIWNRNIFQAIIPFRRSFELQINLIYFLRFLNKDAHKYNYWLNAAFLVVSWKQKKINRELNSNRSSILAVDLSKQTHKILQISAITRNTASSCSWLSLWHYKPQPLEATAPSDLACKQIIQSASERASFRVVPRS